MLHRILLLCLLSACFTGCNYVMRSGANIIDRNTGWEIDHPRDNATGERLDILKNENWGLQGSDQDKIGIS